MTKLWAIRLGALALCSAWAGCASSPMSGVEDSGDETPSDPGVVVIGSKQDAATPQLDAAQPAEPVLPAQPKPDASRPPAKGEGGEGPPLPTDAGGTVGRAPEASVPAPVADAGGGPTEPGPFDAGNPLPPTPVDAGDAGTPPTPVDAGPPVVPDAGRVGCLAGIYKGGFEGEISALLGAIRIDVAGEMTIEVELSGSGDRLTIRSGVLQGTDTSADKNPLFARIAGTLNCATKKLENGVISDGTYNRVDPIWGGPPTTTTFSGTAAGSYSTSPPAAYGTWMVKNGNGTRTSMGTFNVTLQ